MLSNVYLIHKFKHDVEIKFSVSIKFSNHPQKLNFVKRQIARKQFIYCFVKNYNQTRKSKINLKNLLKLLQWRHLVLQYKNVLFKAVIRESVEYPQCLISYYRISELVFWKDCDVFAIFHSHLTFNSFWITNDAIGVDFIFFLSF